MPTYYEYLIVGAGSSGATLAARLADAGRTVLLLESGRNYQSQDTPQAMKSPNPTAVINEPAYSEFRYDALTASRTDAQHARTYWRGRGVGGSSAINGQIAIRGTRDDYDLWQAQGCDGWAYNQVLPYFNKLESDDQFGHEDYHGDHGPIPIFRESLSGWGPVDLAVAQAGLEHGFPFAADHNAPDALGVSPYAINNRNQVRVSVNDGYLEPRRHFNNLSILDQVQVDQIIFSGTCAIGVSAKRNGQQHEYFADKVVLSAGAIHSPTILQRSGIGPAELLNSQDIHIRADLPAGLGLQDHPVINVLLPVKEEYAVPQDFRHTNVCIRFSSDNQTAAPGDLMVVAMNRLGDSIGQALGDAYSVGTFGLTGMWLNQCESRGSVEIQSRDPNTQPAVRLNMLATEFDRRRFFEGWQTLNELLAMPHIKAISEGYWLDRESSQVANLQSFNEFLPWALANASDTQHASCSCRMGAINASTTVVDANCKVIGFDGLYVVDASIMPTVVSANTNLTAIMIGEKIAAQFSGG